MFNIKTINAENLREIQNDVYIIDVREPYEWDEGYIEGARLIPLGALSIQDLNDIKKPIVFYCRAGKRSVEACIKILKENETADVSSLTGGFLAWMQIKK